VRTQAEVTAIQAPVQADETVKDQRSTYADHDERKGSHSFRTDFNAMAGKTTEAKARAVLDLTKGVQLTKRTINDGYTSLAGNQHPDAAGEASTFTRMTEAKERLELPVAAKCRFAAESPCSRPPLVDQLRA